MLRWVDDLCIEPSGLYLDSRVSRPLCFISHAHSDHLGVHDHAIATPATAALALHRVGPQLITELDFDAAHALNPETRITLHSAGHVLGSAMIHVQTQDESLLYTGDFKLRESLMVTPARTVQADVLVMESTYGQPYFRFPHRHLIVEQLIELTTTALTQGRQPIVMGYSLGKAQEIVKILTDAGLIVTCHGAVESINRIYRELGMNPGLTRRYAAADFTGPKALDLGERGVLVAPPQVARTAFADRYPNPCRIMMSGWGLQKNAQYRYGVDHVLPLSDHADFDELLELIDRVQPKKIYTHHGFPEFAETLKARGHDARLARPDPQLSLF